MREGFLLAGYYGFDNLGDELLCQAAYGQLKAAFPQETVVVATKGGKKTGPWPTVNRWSLFDLWSQLRKRRFLVLGGGGLLQNTTSTKSLVYYCGLIALARWAGCRVAALGQSLGPLKGSFARSLARWALKRCSLVTVRDDASEALARDLGLAVERQNDFVTYLAAPSLTHESALLINLRPWKDNALPRQACACAWDYARQKGKKMVFLALSPEDDRLAQELIDEGLLPPMDRVLLEGQNWAQAFARGDEAMGMRLHFGVLSWLVGLPTSLVAYDAKVSGFAQLKGGKVFSPLSPEPQPWLHREQDDTLAPILQKLR